MPAKIYYESNKEHHVTVIIIIKSMYYNIKETDITI